MLDLVGVTSFDRGNLSFHVHLKTSDVSLDHLWFNALEFIRQFLFLFWLNIRLLLAAILDCLLFDI